VVRAATPQQISRHSRKLRRIFQRIGVEVSEFVEGENLQLKTACECGEFLPSGLPRLVETAEVFGERGNRDVVEIGIAGHLRQGIF